MFIEEIAIKAFKNLEGVYTFKKGVNLIVEHNGWGKTNLLEAIDYFANLKSFRGVSDRDLFVWDQDREFIKLTVKLREDKTKLLEVIISRDDDKEEGKIKKKYLVNGAATSAAKLKTHIKTLIYSPHNADIVSSAPDIRRGQFDRMISQLNPQYEDLLKEYRFIYKSRNKVLESLTNQRASLSELTYWNERMISLGQDIVEQRILFLKSIEPYVTSKAIQLFAKSGDLSIHYESKILSPENEIILREKIEQNQAKEIAAGMTLYGPHRDDFVFLYKGKPLRVYGSRGQQRLAGIVLMLAVEEHIFKAQHVRPIMLLDDIFSELDKAHKLNIEKVLKGYKNSQIILTSSTALTSLGKK